MSESSARGKDLAFGTHVQDAVDNACPGQEIRDRTFEFACRIAAFCGALSQERGVAPLMARQLLNCGTAVAAMLEEAKAAESRRDFVSKCSIALKEAREALVRLRIHERAGIGPTAVARALRIEANQLVAIIGAIIRNTKLNSPSEF